MSATMNTLDVDNALQQFKAVAEKLQWQSMHSPRNLATAVAVETGELLEQFQWLDENQRPDTDGVADEIADIALYLIALCDKLCIDFADALAAKTAKNQARFA